MSSNIDQYAIRYLSFSNCIISLVFHCILEDFVIVIAWDRLDLSKESVELILAESESRFPPFSVFIFELKFTIVLRLRCKVRPNLDIMH